MKKLIKIIAATSIALASATVSADEMTVGGVTWDPDYKTGSATDFLSNVFYSQWYGESLSAVDYNAVAPGQLNSVLQGVGEINSLNGKSAMTSPFVCATCELTFSFGGIVFDGDLSDGSLFNLAQSADSAFLNIYFDDSADFDNGNLNGQADVEAAEDGSLFLSLALNTLQEAPGFSAERGFLDSFWDVTGGAAAYHFDTESQLFGSDFGFGAYSVFQGVRATSGGLANSNTIPEPTSLAIFGLGLLGLAGASRRKKA